MRTTLNLPDSLVREAKIAAIHGGHTLTDLLVEGLKLRLAQADGNGPLPVSASRGGLQAGLDWKNLNEAGGDDWR